MLELILGGARSGKSRYAESCVDANDKSSVLIATATADDDEMQQRIALHKKNRNNNIVVIEEPFQLANVLNECIQNSQSIVVDCLTLWVSNLLLKYKENIESSDEIVSFINSLEEISKCKSSSIYIVSNEVGMGIIPLGELNRIYCDVIGRLHQVIASHAQRVTLMVAGLPHSIKNETNKL